LCIILYNCFFLYYYFILNNNIIYQYIIKWVKTSLIQETCIELFKKDYQVGIISNKQGEYCDTYPEKIVILENEKKEEEKRKNGIVKLEDIREKIFNEVDKNVNKNNKKVDNRNGLSINKIKRKNSSENEDENDIIINEGLHSPRKTQKNSFWEEKRNSTSKNPSSIVTFNPTLDNYSSQLPPSIPSQSHINSSSKNVTWKLDEIINTDNQKVGDNIMNDDHKEDNYNISFDNISYDKVNEVVDDNCSFSLVSYGVLGSPKADHDQSFNLGSPSSFIKMPVNDHHRHKQKYMQKDFNSSIPLSKNRFSLLDPGFGSLSNSINSNFQEENIKSRNENINSSFSHDHDSHSSNNKNEYINSYNDEMPFVMDDISMDYFTSDAIHEAERSNALLIMDHHQNQFYPTINNKDNIDSILNDNDSIIEYEHNTSHSSINPLVQSSYNHSLPIDVKSPPADYDLSDWSLTHIKSSLSNLSIHNYGDTEFKSNMKNNIFFSLPKNDFFKPTIKLNDSLIKRNSSETSLNSINSILEDKSIKALLGIFFFFNLKKKKNKIICVILIN